MVRLENVRKHYTGAAHPAVADLSLAIQQGEIFTLLGPSGCGKTTPLRIVAGLEVPDAGAVYFQDRPIVVVSQRLFVPAHKRNVGMVFQSYAIWPHMTVEENVAYPLKQRHVSPHEIRDRVARALQLVDLTGLEKRPAPLLSGGQQQRVALARALVYEPSLLLLDEPFSNLDSKLREQMRIEVKLLQARLRVTVLFVTHDQVEALSLSNRIALMDLGCVQQVGSPRELYERPANAFVRDFLGRTILLRGVVQAASAAGQVAVAVDGAPACVVFGRAYVTEGVGVGSAVYLAMRPEDAEVVAMDADVKVAESVRGTVEAALFVGERTEYRVGIDAQGSVLAYGRREETFGAGQPVQLALRPESVSVWPA
jgi:ABC-type Fe3+/spermidine/putrescine transport system ATPase subunit